MPNLADSRVQHERHVTRHLLFGKDKVRVHRMAVVPERLVGDRDWVLTQQPTDLPREFGGVEDGDLRRAVHRSHVGEGDAF